MIVVACLIIILSRARARKKEIEKRKQIERKRVFFQEEQDRISRRLQREYNERERARQMRKEFSNEQKAKGLYNYIDKHGVERWGTKEQVKEWKKEDLTQ